jgi:NitT/TauT family transport system substrate-binding protein
MDYARSESNISDRRVSRRRFVRAATGLGLAPAAAALFAGCGDAKPSARSAASEAPPETTTIRIAQPPSGICTAPQYIAEDLLRAEGFTTVQYVKVPGIREFESALAAGEVDIGQHYAAPIILRVDAGAPLVMLAGIHVGCFELFGTDQVRAIRDLKGKAVAVTELGVGGHLLLSIMAEYVGLDPRKDINWIVRPAVEGKQLLAEGKVDAYIGFPPDPQELRAKRVGHVVVNSAVDRPWSQYFCCMAASNREFVRKNPVAAKRAVRAFVKAADICAAEPERAARLIVDKGYTPNYENALQALKDLPYNKWREYDPEDTVRFYALRLQQAGITKSSPKSIIERGTDWRFFNELKKELKT